MVTPQTESPEIALELGLDALFFKREDLHPLGSHKGRSIPVMIDMKVAKGAKNFALSSSGNAALAAVRYIQKLNTGGSNLTLSILVGEHINGDKLQTLRDEIKDAGIKIETTARPLQALFNVIKNNAKTSLRQSVDPEALVGYKSLADEIAQTPNLGAVFIATSSGTTAQALADAGLPNINIVQTVSVSPISTALENPLGVKVKEIIPETSLADAIVDKVAHRKTTLMKSVRATGGTGWIATNALIMSAQRMLHERAGIEATPNGALALAGLIHAIQRGAKFNGAVVCIITGK